MDTTRALRRTEAPPGTADTTCNDWSPSGTKGIKGLAHRTNFAFWEQYNFDCAPDPVYCVEQ